MRILIAEDEPVSALVLMKALQSFGHEVVTASHGGEAWELFEREPVRLIVSDWIMPELDGLELCRRIRAKKGMGYTYFILLTSMATATGNFEQAMGAGVDDFLGKPLDRMAIRMRLAVAERILGFTSEISRLSGMIPMCGWCRRVRNDRDYWERVESYLSERTGQGISHGMCPECYAREMGEVGESAENVHSADFVGRVP